MPYRPDPVPPGAISPSIMLNSSVAPPMDVYESWNESTAPVEVPVVAVANAADCGTPKRTSVPSEAAPTAVGTVPCAAPWAASLTARLPTRMTAITATIAKPCRLSPTSRPKVRGSEKLITSSRKISSALVQLVGFSNGWAELTL